MGISRYLAYSCVFFVILCVPYSLCDITTVYMVNSAGATLTGYSFRVELTQSLLYNNNMAVSTTFTVPSSPSFSKFLIYIRRFSLEGMSSSGTCNQDYLNIHDGTSQSAPTLNSQPLCGTFTQANQSVYYTTGPSLTLRFVSDQSATFRGFEFIVTAVNNGACSPSATYFSCADQLCVSAKIKCDNIQQCLDGSDEDSSLCKSTLQVYDNSLYAIVFGVVFAFLALVLVITIPIVHVRARRRYANFLGRLAQEQPVIFDSPAYPVTSQYHWGGAKWEFGSGTEASQSKEKLVAPTL